MACASEKENLDIALVRGEKIRFIVDYSLYDHNINGMIGLVIRENSGNGKPLVYVKLAGGEWIEPSQEMFISLLSTAGRSAALGVRAAFHATVRSVGRR